MRSLRVPSELAIQLRSKGLLFLDITDTWYRIWEQRECVYFLHRSVSADAQQ